MHKKLVLYALIALFCWGAPVAAHASTKSLPISGTGVGYLENQGGKIADSPCSKSEKEPSVVLRSTYIVSRGEAILVDVTMTGNFHIPETVSSGSMTYKVTEIADYAFSNNRGITSITGGKNITRIGKRAFEGCTSLKRVDVRDSGVTVIDSRAFAGCSSLKTIFINGNKLKKIRKNAFRDVPSKAQFRIKASGAKKYSQIVRKIKASGVKKGKFKKI